MFFRRLAILLCVTMSGAGAGAQVVNAPSDLYRFSGGANTFGCFGVCDCSINQNPSLRGTFRLNPIPSPPFIETFAVSGVNWWMDGGEGELVPVTGDGVYTRDVSNQTHRMQLTLSTRNAEPLPYDSGLQPLPKSPGLSITVRYEEGQCTFDEFSFTADLVHPSEIDPYFLRNSEFQSGCFAPCMCPVLSIPMRGGFNVTPILNETFFFAELAVTDVEFQLGPEGSVLQGNGLYRLLGDFVLNEQLLLELREAGAPAYTLYDSGVVLSPSTNPLIDLAAATNDFFCLNQVVDILATPCAGDLDVDADTDLSDLGAILSNYGCISGASKCLGDLDGNGTVDLADLGAVLSDYGCGLPAGG